MYKITFRINVFWFYHKGNKEFFLFLASFKNPGGHFITKNSSSTRLGNIVTKSIRNIMKHLVKSAVQCVQCLQEKENETPF